MEKFFAKLTGNDKKEKLIEGSRGAQTQLSREEEESAASTYASQTTAEGLSSAEVEARLEKFGRNILEEKKKNELLVFLGYFWGPMPIMIWVATLIVAIEGDIDDMSVLLTLQMINGGVGYYEERSAGDAIEALKKSLAPKANAKRDGRWREVESTGLVPGDLINLKLGNIVPADSLLKEGKPLEVDQAALTGESLPATKHPGERVLMGSVIVRGELEALVLHTGKNTFFGRAAGMVSKASEEQQGRFAKVMFQNTMVLFSLSCVCCTVIFYKVYQSGLDVLEALSTVVVILVACIPIAMQIVSTTVMAVGSRSLAEKKAIVARLSAIEELAGMNMLCSDKTGTLTLNKLKMNDPVIIHPSIKEYPDELTFLGALAAKRMEGADAIDTVITNALSAQDTARLAQYRETDFTPFDPVTKRTEAIVVGPQGEMVVTKGATKVVLELCADKERVREAVMSANDGLASRGFRSLGVAVKYNSKQAGGGAGLGSALLGSGGDGWQFMGVLSLFDPPREDTAETLSAARSKGISVKMVTGDQTAIAIETSRSIKLAGDDMKLTPRILDMARFEAAEAESELTAARLCEEVDGFAEVYPEHKYRIVELLQGAGHTVGMTGDGVNDAPALKKAQIGIAVEGATDAARAAADIVLTAPGLSVIIDAILTARMIFARVRNYVIYRIACTLQLVFFFFLGCLFFNPRDFYCYRAAGKVTGSAFDSCDYDAEFDDDADHDYNDANSSYPYYYPSAKYSFCIPVLGIVIITILNDGCMLTIARDHVVAAETPQNWDLPQLRCIATACGMVPLLSSLVLLYMGLSSADGMYPSYASWFGVKVPDAFQNSAGDRWYLPYEQLTTMMYLKISISDFLTLFAARTRGPFWSRAPSPPLVAAFALATVVATIISIAVDVPDNTYPMHHISLKAACFVWVWNLLFFALQDGAKLAVYAVIDRRARRREAALAAKSFGMPPYRGAPLGGSEVASPMQQTSITVSSGAKDDAALAQAQL